MLARQSKDALGAPSTALSGPYPPYANHPLGAPSLALLPRYGGGGGGPGGGGFRRGGTGASGLAAQSVGLGMLLPGGTTAATLQREPSAGAPGLTGFGGGMGSGSGLGASSVELPTPVEAEGEEDVHAPVQAQRLWQGKSEAASSPASTAAARGHGGARRSRSFTSCSAHASGTPTPPSRGSQPPPGGLPSSPMQIALSSALLQPSRPPPTPSRLAISSRQHHSHNLLGSEATGGDTETGAAARAGGAAAVAAGGARPGRPGPADSYARSPLGGRPPPRRSFSEDGAADAARARVAAAAASGATASAAAADETVEQARAEFRPPLQAPQPPQSPQLPSQRSPFLSHPDEAARLDSAGSGSRRGGPPSWVLNPMAEGEPLPLGEVEGDAEALVLATATPEGLGLATVTPEALGLAADVAASAAAAEAQRSQAGQGMAMSPAASTSGMEGTVSTAPDSPQRSEPEERLSVIAHTSRAFGVVDAGGVPLVGAAPAAAPQHARPPRVPSVGTIGAPLAAGQQSQSRIGGPRRTVTEASLTSPRRQQPTAPSWHPAAAAAPAPALSRADSFTAGAPPALAHAAGGARSGHVRFFRSFSLAAGNPGIAAVSVGAAAADADSSHLMDRLRAARERANSLSRRRVHSAELAPGDLLSQADQAAAPSRELNRSTGDGADGADGAGIVVRGGGGDDDDCERGDAPPYYRTGTGISSVSGMAESAAAAAAAADRPDGLVPSASGRSVRLATAPLPGRVSALLARSGTPPRAPSSSGVSGVSYGGGSGGLLGKSGGGLVSPRSRSPGPGDAGPGSGVGAPVTAVAAGASVAAAAANAAGGGGGCTGPAQCPTCGKCTCAVCKSRAVAAAQVGPQSPQRCSLGFDNLTRRVCAGAACRSIFCVRMDTVITVCLVGPSS